MVYEYDNSVAFYSKVPCALPFDMITVPCHYQLLFFVKKFASGLQRQYTKIRVSSGEIPLSNITLLHFSVSVLTQYSVHKCIDFQVSSFMHSEKSDSCGVTISNRKRQFGNSDFFYIYKIENYITAQINKKVTQ